MPSRLRPTASVAAEAILVGDPGRALLLAQELLEQPKMSNHARGLWGYSGATPAGRALTIQSTGMGGPSAALVLGDLAKLGVRRVVRVGTCAALGEDTALGELIVVRKASAEGGSIASLGLAPGETVPPDARLTELLGSTLGEGARAAVIASFDFHPAEPAPGARMGADVLAADMQTAPLLARARSLGIEAAAVLIVAERASGERLEAEALAEGEKRAGRAAADVLSG